MGASRIPFLVKASAPISAPADRVYGIIADYRNGHPHILPKPFGALTVDRGGVGAGTAVQFTMRVLGRTRTYHAVISEPEPGRVLVERNVGAPASITTFVVDPQGDGSTVTISTELEIRAGWLGAVEGYLTERFLKPIYLKELNLLARRAASTTNA
jgi:hypothetical protein